MTVKVIADTLSDITHDLAEELGLTLIPLYVRFGEEIYKDRVEITSEQFYERLVNEKDLPSTTQPSPNDFLALYKEAAKTTDEILVICLSSKLSGSYHSALQAKEMMEGKCRIEVVDTKLVALAIGLIVVKCCRKAAEGTGLTELAAWASEACKRSHLIAYFDTLKYLAKGGRIGKAQGLLGSMLSVKPILTMQDGEMAPLTRVRSKSAGVNYLVNSGTGYPQIDLIGIEHCTTPEDADLLTKMVQDKLPGIEIFHSIISPVIGTYSGPGAMAISVLEKE